jgi:His/Glu/Gln/Arg/opine family amino acid ABC transporter permease subunit
MTFHFELIKSSIPYILHGVVVTLEFTLLSALVGFIWGTVLAVLKISKIKPVQWLAIAYTSIFRGLPLLVTLSLVFYATPQLTGYNITPYQAGVITFGLNSAAYISEVIRGGILAVDKGQREAAMSLGVPYRRLMFDIVLPQAVKNILPALVNESIALLKDSTLVSTIGAADLLRRADVVMGDTFTYFEPLITVAVIYYVMVMLLTWFGRGLERRLRRSD